jgi:hypothetical protein
MWLEISRDIDHEGSGWGFGECPWAPLRNWVKSPVEQGSTRTFPLSGPR